MNDVQKRFQRRLQLEKELNSVQFIGLPLGSLIAYQLAQSIQRPDKRKSNKLLKWKLFANFFSPDVGGFACEKIWLSPTDASQRCVGLFLELASILKPGNFMFLLPLKGKPFIRLPRKPRLSFRLWMIWVRNYRRIKKDFIRIIGEQGHEISDNKGFLAKIELDLIIQTQLATMLDEIIRKSLPTVILVDYDRSPFNAVLVTAANKYGVKTQTLIHGSTYPIYNYIPILAQECSCWGSLQKAQFIQAGVEQHRLNIVGNPKFSRNIRVSKEGIKKRLGINADIKIAVFGNNRLPSRQHIGLLKDFIEAYQPWDKWLPVVRLHPIEQYSDYAGVIDDSCRFLLLKDQCSLEETLQAADLMFIHNSNIAQDAMLYGVPVVVYNPTDISAGIGEILKEQAETPYLRSRKELNDFLNDFNKPGAGKFDFIERQSVFFKEYCLFIGHDSAVAIARSFGPRHTEWIRPESLDMLRYRTV